MLTDKQRETLVNSILKEFNLEEQRELGSRYLRNKIEQGVRFGCVELDFQVEKKHKEISKRYNINFHRAPRFIERRNYTNEELGKEENKRYVLGFKP